MEERLTLPQADEMLAQRLPLVYLIRKTGNRSYRHDQDFMDFANMGDVCEAALWKCEIPMTDDEF